ncbi:9882_t:CDS:10 [Paraglomus occultum]|uniref:9882_t:CDS:1 n=1 Tax=Paraglomus occultum TaxID=144539 RepID=A0A9N8Z7P0_9GLOM|nr:9882_t:CDS:10 [Paraglomus occultum]
MHRGVTATVIFGQILLIDINDWMSGENPTVNSMIDITNYSSEAKRQEPDVDVIVGRFRIVRKCGLGSNHHVWKANDLKSDSTVALKYYNDYKTLAREQRCLSELRGVENVIQMLEPLAAELVIALEFGQYDLGTVMHYLTVEERQQEKSRMIRHIAAGLGDIHLIGIVHCNLSPGDIMLFKKGEQKIWKLVDFDSACTTFENVEVSFKKLGYCSPELITAKSNKQPLFATPSLDMFSFGLIIYFIETGSHYFKEKLLEQVELLKSNDELILGQEIRDSNTREILEGLLKKPVTERMDMATFKNSEYFRGLEPALWITTVPKSDRIANENVTVAKRDQHQLSSAPASLNGDQLVKIEEKFDKMFDKLDNLLDICEELSGNIPRWLEQLNNQKIPRLFVLLPQQRNWMSPTNWTSKSFLLYFLCEHENCWHVPKNAQGYKLKQNSEFIRKYGKWINIGLQSLTMALKVVTSGIFPIDISAMLSNVFDIHDDADISKYLQQIADSMETWSSTMEDSNPEFQALDQVEGGKFQVMNMEGHRALETYINNIDNTRSYGGLVQGYHYGSKKFIWVCEEHQHEYECGSNNDLARSPSSQPSESDFNDPLPGPSVQPERSLFKSFWGGYKVNTEEIEAKLLSEPYIEGIMDKLVLKARAIIYDLNKNARKTKHRKRYTPRTVEFGSDGEYYLTKLETRIGGFTEKEKKFLAYALERYIGMLLFFLNFFVRFNCVEESAYATRAVNSLTASSAFHKVHDQGVIFHAFLHKIIFMRQNSSLSSLSTASAQEKINKLIPTGYDKCSSNHASFAVWASTLQWSDQQWPLEKILFDKYVASSEIDAADKLIIRETAKGLLFAVKRSLKSVSKPIAELTLKNCGDEDMFCATLKQVYMYWKYKLNECDYIIQFYGVTVKDCRLCLLFEWADGDLFTYMKTFSNMPSLNVLSDWREKLRISYEIAMGLAFLHKRFICHLDIRSSNILLSYSSDSKRPKAKLSGFRSSKKMTDRNTTNIYIELTDEEYKRWYCPQRLLHYKYPCDEFSDIYSLAIIFWEIAMGTGQMPYSEVDISHLRKHIYNKNRNKLPEDIPNWAVSYKSLVERMWSHEPDHRGRITSIVRELSMLMEKAKTEL